MAALIFIIVLIYSLIDTARTDALYASKPCFYLKNDECTPIWLTRKGGYRTAKGEPVYMDYVKDIYGQSAWVHVTKSKVILDDPRPRQMKEAMEKTKKNREEAIANKYLGYLKFYPEYKKFIATELSTEKPMYKFSYTTKNGRNKEYHYCMYYLKKAGEHIDYINLTARDYNKYPYCDVNFLPI